MDALNIFLTILAVVIAGLIVYYQYYYKQKLSQDSKILSIFRFVTFLGILMLLINPRFIQHSTEIIKPDLMLAVDNSESITHLGSEKIVKQLVYNFNTDKELNQRFEMNSFQFGERLSADTLLNFEATQSNIYSAIKDLNLVSNQKSSPIILISDGNQTYGQAYDYMNSKHKVFPIVIGDTIVKSDLEISLVNVNAYATLKNNFPVEVFLNYHGKTAVETKFLIEKDGVLIHSEKVLFSKDRLNYRSEFYLPADEMGMQLYKARLIPFEGEDNTLNNSFDFGIEVIDEKTKVAVVYDVLHPDLGMVKRSIESNQQRTVELIPVDEISKMDKDFSIFVLYQPNESFQEIMEQLVEDDSSYFIITGTHTNWAFLNKIQNAFSREESGVTENYFPVYQDNFKAFQTEDLGFDRFGPLIDYFGSLSFNVAYESLLSQSVNGIKSNDPLLVGYQEGINRRVVLFGENIWKWRLNSFQATNSFEKFDQFFNSLIQYLHLTDKNKSMEVIYSAVYHSNDPIIIKVKNYDSNLNPDLNSDIFIQFKDGKESIPFYVKNNAYETQIPTLKEGIYQFEVINKNSKKKQSGSFIVAPFTLEQEKTGANVAGLNQLSMNSEGQLFYQDQFAELKQVLLENPSFRSVEKENIKMISLIDWKWLLGLIVLSLGLEWSIRKYRGLA